MRLPDQGSTELGLPKERSDAMSDAIFGVAMTLLALDVRVSNGVSESQLPDQLILLQPRIVIYLTSFAFIGVVWLYLQHFQHMLVRYDLITITLSLVSAAGVILLPFSSSTAASYPASAVAQQVFAWNFAAILVFYGINTLYSISRKVPACVDRRLLWAFALVTSGSAVWLGAVVPLVAAFRPVWAIKLIAFNVFVGFAALWFMHPEFAKAYAAIKAEQDGRNLSAG